MNRMRSAAAIVAASCAIAHAQVSVINQPGTVIGSFTANVALMNNGADNIVLVVPAGRAARVTDVWISNRANAYCMVHIQSDADNSISCVEGNANQDRSVRVRGYYFTVP